MTSDLTSRPGVQFQTTARRHGGRRLSHNPALLRRVAARESSLRARRDLEYYFEVPTVRTPTICRPGPSDAPARVRLDAGLRDALALRGACTRTSDGGAVFKVWAQPRGARTGRPVQRLEPELAADGEERGVLHAQGRGARQREPAYKFVFQPARVWKRTPAAGAEPVRQQQLRHRPAAYVWGDAGWQTPDFEDMILYELHVGTFSGLNDGAEPHGPFRDIVDRHSITWCTWA